MDEPAGRAPMSDGTPKRRWRFRFNLLALLVLTTTTAIALASIEWNPPKKPFRGVAFPQTTQPHPSGDGVIVTHIRAGFAAAKVGVRAGDRIVAVNGKKVIDYRDLLSKVRKIKIGEPVTLTGAKWTADSSWPISNGFDSGKE